MTKKQFSIVVILVIISSLVGGALSNWFLTPKPVNAGQKETKTPKVITAHGFRVIDEEGNVCISYYSNI